MAHWHPRLLSYSLLRASAACDSKTNIFTGVPHLADLRLLTRVGQFVAGQGARLREGLAARLADVRLLARVDPKVPNQASWLQESLAARLADVRFLSRVDQHVRGKDSGRQDGLAARVRDVRFFALARLAAEVHHSESTSEKRIARRRSKRASEPQHWSWIAFAGVGREQHTLD